MEPMTGGKEKAADDAHGLGLDNRVESPPCGLDGIDHFRDPLGFSVYGERAPKCASRSGSGVRSIWPGSPLWRDYGVGAPGGSQTTAAS
jgi:hypothetical protein